MPIYEYWCPNCQRKVMLYLKTSSQSPPPCPQCGNDTLNRLFSTFSVQKTNSEIYENILNDSQLTRGLMDNNPRALAEWNKRMSHGEPVAQEYKDIVDKMEQGEFPTELAGRGTTGPPKETE